MNEQQGQSRSHTRAYGLRQPGLVLLLVDQSDAMAPYEWAQRATYQVNEFIYEAVLVCRSGPRVKRSLQLGIITYGGKVTARQGGWMDELLEHPLRTVVRERLIATGTGRFETVVSERPVW